jgi:acetyl esterase
MVLFTNCETKSTETVDTLTNNSDKNIYKEYEIITDWTESVEIYKSDNNHSLNAYIYTPADISESEQRPAILFFHGGGWFEGNPDGFKRNCRKFACRGLVSISFEYRLSNFNDINPIHCIMDAKSAVRWVRENALRLKIDPNKIVIAGQSAGGHLALCTALIDGFNDLSDDLNISCVPNAVICYSACFDTQEDSWFDSLIPERVDINETSPYYNIRSGLPPVLIFHGTADDIVPYQQAVDFYNGMVENGNYCVLHTFESSGHNLWPTHHEQIRIVSEDFLIGAGFKIN